MAARTPRRSFVAPFVVTLAALPGCMTSTGGGAPTPTTTTATPHEQPPTVITNPPRPRPEDVPPQPVGNPPPPPQVATRDRRWSLHQDAAGVCAAHLEIACPANARCNPPPPIKVACPQGMSATTPAAIVQLAGQSECQLELSPPACPPNVMCNPPRPTTVACPSR